MSKMIEIKKLRKEFGPLLAVDDVSFSVSKGEVLGFLGPNGAGKSTTMKMAVGFLAPTSGTAVIRGYDILKEPLKAKREIGYLPEGAPGYPDMTPASFLKFVAEIRGLHGANARKRIDEAISKTALESHLDIPIDHLSKGFRRRVGLAQAILHDPPVLIMDEPTDGLDPNQKFEVRKLIAEMARDKAIILSTHILEEVEAVCTRAVIIAAGKVIADGTPIELQARAANHHAVTLRVAGVAKADAKQKLSGLAEVAKVEDVVAENGATAFRLIPRKRKNSILHVVGQFARDQQWELEELREEQGRLDEVFREMTREATVKAGRES